MNKELLKTYAEYKEQLDLLKEKLKNKKEEFEKSTESLKLEIDSSTNALYVIESKLKEQALLEYAKTNSKKLTGGLGIRVKKLLKYDHKKAYDWALEKKMCLSLNTKEFETIAKVQPIDFVTFDEETTVTIPSVIKLED